MRVITFVCLDKMGGGDIATSLEMIRSLANNPLYSDVEINLVYFTMKDPSTNPSLLRDIANYIHVKTTNKSAGMRRENYSISAPESTVTQLIDLLERSDGIVLYPRTPGESEDMCEWGMIVRQYLEPHKNKMITVTEPSGSVEEKSGYCLTQNRLHLGFHSSSAGVPYPDVSSTSLTSPEAIQLNALHTETGAKFFFIYGHTIEHLSRFFFTIMNMNKNPTNPVVFVMVGFNKYTAHGNSPQESLNEYIQFEIERVPLRLGLVGEFSQMPSPTPLLSSDPAQTLTNSFYFMHFEKVTPLCFIELMRISENITGCTGAHSLATAISLLKVPFYEPLYEYHKGMYRDLMMSSVHMAPVLSYMEFVWHGEIIFYMHHPELKGQVSWHELFDAFFRSISSPTFVSEMLQKVIIETDMTRKFPECFSQVTRYMRNPPSPLLFFTHAASDAASLEQAKSSTIKNKPGDPF
jgi:hypothetical protein